MWERLRSNVLFYRKGEEEKQEEDLQEIREALESLHQDRQKLDSIQNPHRLYYTRRIHTEEQAKVVAASWGTELFQCLATIAILHQNELKNRRICITFFISS